MNYNPNNLLLATAYFPPVEYFAYLSKFENVVIESKETYLKQTYRNRCNIYSEKGSMSLTIPVSKPFGNHTQTINICISDIGNWQQNHWRAICTAYQNSPFFLFYKDDLEVFFQKKTDNLLALNLDILNACCKLTGIKTNISYSDDFIQSGIFPNDHRFDISPKKPPTFTQFPDYFQVFSDRHGFIPNMSILDLLFNLGPDTLNYLNLVR